jgi:hypothetical protein
MLKSINTKLFPSDFFEPILPKQNKKSFSTTDSHGDKKSVGGPRSIYVSLEKEYDEDKELLDLLSYKRNLSYIIQLYFIYSPNQ